MLPHFGQFRPSIILVFLILKLYHNQRYLPTPKVQVHCVIWRVFAQSDGDDESKQLVIDEEAAVVVRRIFQMCVDGHGPSYIARTLSDEHIVNPTTHKRESGIVHEFIEKIIVYEAVSTKKHSSIRTQRVDIVFNGVGILDTSKMTSQILT
jgi:hypothetical protein